MHRSSYFICKRRTTNVSDDADDADDADDDDDDDEDLEDLGVDGQ